MRWRGSFAAVSVATAILTLPTPGIAKSTPGAWRAIRTDDPITGAKSCVVSAFDYVGKTRFSRSGYLYPVVEMNEKAGLLVGVSSGGRFRLPTGDIVWRVDDRPFRELRAAENPAMDSRAIAPPVAAGSDAAAKAVQNSMDLAMRMAAGMAATSTVASCDRAREMLAELRAGHSLMFRASAAAAAYGLPDTNIYRVGQATTNGIRPVPIDASFEAALVQCGIPAQ